ncbi:DUF5677 domain-containing protein [Aeromicrobium sp. CF3.5]|uniref:DUF5677 domain-containing protein n=1 Tax=Aeromicrobium sp. CF3.5 TaxID=3373078 RepID=UPI003EE79C91
MATGALSIGDWVRDDLPDLLWPALVLAENGTSAGENFVRWQRALLDEFPDANRSDLASGLDGRMTSLDRLIDAVPDIAESVRTHARKFGLLSDTVTEALRLYPERPGQVLGSSDPSVLTNVGGNLLVKAVYDCMTDGHREAVIKCISIWAAVQAGTFSTDHTTIDLLHDYPTNFEKRAQADTVVRASWGASKGAQEAFDPGKYEHAVKWAKIFWGVNSMTTPCIRKKDAPEADQPASQDEVADASTDSATAEDDKLSGSTLRERALDLLSNYVEAIDKSPSRLYDPDREEVNTGLVMKAGRDVAAALSAPDLWCSEHGAHVGRTLVENRILLAWMYQQDQASIYSKYKSYGAGKAKLYALIAEELPTSLRINGHSESVDRLREVSHNDDIFDYRAVDISSTFADGKSLRQMAEESGLIDLYRHAYQLESGVAHSEWWSVELHAMERCRNPLHRAHLIPSLSLSAGDNAELARSWVVALHALIVTSLDILDIPEDVRRDAFGWLTDQG